MAMLVICMQSTWWDSLTERKSLIWQNQLKNQCRILSLLVFPVASWSTRLLKSVCCVWYIQLAKPAFCFCLQSGELFHPACSHTEWFSHSNAKVRLVLFPGVWPVCTGAWVWPLQSSKSTIAVLWTDSSIACLFRVVLRYLLVVKGFRFPCFDWRSCSRWVDMLQSLHQAWVSRPGLKTTTIEVCGK